MASSSNKSFTYTRTAWLLAACVMALVVMVGNSDLVLGKATPIWDAVDNYAPLFSLIADHAKAGKLLTWNPWSVGGAPDFADPSFGAISPLVILFGVIARDPFNAFIAYWIAFWILGGVGVLVLCRHLKCPAWGGLIASLGFVSCGFYTAHAEHTAILYSFSFLPWIVWRFDLALARKSYWAMVQTGVLWGLSALGGYPALVILDPLFLALWALGRTSFGTIEFKSDASGGSWKQLRFCVLGLALIGVVGVIIMSPSYVAFIKYTKGYTYRTSALSRERALTEGPLPPQAILTLASPYLYNLNWPPYSIWPETDLSMSNIYSGALVIVFALAALWRRDKWRWWLGLIAAFFLACSVGKHLPVRGWVYTLIPPTRYFRFPSLFSAYAILILCILAGMATSDLEGEPETDGAVRRRVFLVSVLVAGVAILSYRWLVRTVHLHFFGLGAPSTTLLIVWFSLVLVFLLWWQKDITRRLFLVALVVIAAYDAGTAFSVSVGTMYTSATLPWWNAMKSQHKTSFDLTSHGLTRTLFAADDLGGFYRHNRNIATRSPAFENATGLLNGYAQPFETDPTLGKVVVGSQRTWFSADPVWLPPTDQTFERMRAAAHSSGVPPLILHPNDDGPPYSTQPTGQAAATQGAASTLTPLSPASVDLVQYTPNTLEFRYHADRDGWLFVSDRWANSWTAEVNGKTVSVVPADFLFRAVPVTAGENLVSFQYRPKGYVLMVMISWGTLLLIVIVSIIRHYRGRGRPRRHRSGG